MRLRLAGMVSVISACVWWGIATVSGAEQQPNVVLFLVDDMGPMDTSVPFMTDGHGNAKKYPLNDYYRTPAMARLAASGIRFSTFYAMSVWLTNPNLNNYRTKRRKASGDSMDSIRGK